MQLADHATSDSASASYYRQVAFTMPYMKEMAREYSVQMRLTERQALLAGS